MRSRRATTPARCGCGCGSCVFAGGGGDRARRSERSRAALAVPLFWQDIRLSCARHYSTPRACKRRSKNDATSYYEVASPHGDRADYLTRRIARDHPDILERMKAGHYRSVRQAALEAGIVKPVVQVPAEPARAARALLRHFNADELREIVEFVMSALEK